MTTSQLIEKNAGTIRSLARFYGISIDRAMEIARAAGGGEFTTWAAAKQMRSEGLI